eukprot:Hpha_TRINITY_DN31165_c0_g1::TRINITY_DN31165_c0_g1_i1::g.33095::m.33095
MDFGEAQLTPRCPSDASLPMLDTLDSRRTESSKADPCSSPQLWRRPERAAPAEYVRLFLRRFSERNALFRARGVVAVFPDVPNFPDVVLLAGCGSSAAKFGDPIFAGAALGGAALDGEAAPLASNNRAAASVDPSVDWSMASLPAHSDPAHPQRLSPIKYRN